MAVILNFYSIIVEISGNHEEVIHRLQQEFRYFSAISPLETQKDIKISLHQEAFNTNSIPPLCAHKITQNALIYKLGPKRFINYHKSWCVIDEQSQSVDIYCTQKDECFEIAYLTIHSLVGERLELKGLTRLHAMALETKNYQLIIMLPSRGGKSTLMTSLLEKYPHWKIISDDMPLITLSGKIKPFPSKISLDSPPDHPFWKTVPWEKFERVSYPPKWLCSVMDLPHGISHDSSKPILLIQGERLSCGNPMIDERSFVSMMKALSTHMIVGVGLPIILEYFLKFQFSDIFKLIHLGTRRTICAVMLSFKAKKLTFYLSPDKQKNIEALGTYLHE